MAPHLQDLAHLESLSDPESFWMHHAQQLHWHKEPSRCLKQFHRTLSGGIRYPSFAWFPDGEISTAYNCVDRHVENGNGESTAIIWDSPVTGSKEKYTYQQLLYEIETLAGVLREEGVRKGDVVLVYMPMIPAALFAILAISRLGAIHAVVFGGFAPAALAQRIEASKPIALMTASCGIEGSKGPLPYNAIIEEALRRSTCKPEKVIIWQRDHMRWDPILEEKGERSWQDLVRKAKNRGLKADAVPIKSSDGLYIIYTSGTTGVPKGIIRSAGGHAVGLDLSIKYLFGICGPGDVIFCASDIGWVVGHSYIIYGPLLAGAATVLFEGKPVGTPDASTFWRIIEEYKVNVLSTAPTALRAIRREDPDNELFTAAGKRRGLKQLRGLFLAGERSEPSLIRMYQDLLQTHCASGAQVIDNWWSSESGSPISGIALKAAVADKKLSSRKAHELLPIKPGSAGKPMPGYDVRVVRDDGGGLKRGQIGNIVLAIPLAPTGFTTLFNDEKRFYNGYMKRFGGKWIDTGDTGVIDSDGYIHVMSRSDDVINVAAHRLSTGSIEEAISSHPAVVECCVVGMPDALKGQLPFAFVTLATLEHLDSCTPSDTLLKEVQTSIRKQIGAIASLGGIIQGEGMIPKTRSGKTLRRVLKELVENAVNGDYEKEVQTPATVEDISVVDTARSKIKQYFQENRNYLQQAAEKRAKI